jgi:hypothetical protein
LLRQRQQTAKDKGAYRQSQIDQGVQTERNYGISVQHQNAENAAFGVKARTRRRPRRRPRRLRLRRSIRKAVANRNKNQDQALATQKFKEQVKKDNKPKAPKPAYTPAQHLAAKKDLRRAVALVQGEAGKPSNSKPEFWNRAFQALVGKNIDPAIARAAIQLIRTGSVGPHTRQTLKDDYGITSFPKGARRKPKPGTSSGGGGGPEGTGQTTVTG